MTFSSVIDSLTAVMDDDIFNFPHSSTSGEQLIYDTQTQVRASSHPSVSSARAYLSGKCIIGVPTTSSASFPIKSNQSWDQICTEVECLCKWVSLHERYERMWSLGWNSNIALCMQEEKEMSSNVAHIQKYNYSSSPIQQDTIKRKLAAQVKEKVREQVRMSRPLTRLEEIVVSTLQRFVAAARKINPLAPLEDVERECMAFLLNGCKGPSPYENVTNGARVPGIDLVSGTSRLEGNGATRSPKAQVYQQHQSHISRPKNDSVQERDVVKPFYVNTSLSKESESTEETKECELRTKLRKELLVSLPTRSDSMQRRYIPVRMEVHSLNAFPKPTESRAEEKQRHLMFHVENKLRDKYSVTSLSGALTSGLASIPMAECKGRINRKRPASPDQLDGEENHKKKCHFTRNTLNS